MTDLSERYHLYITTLNNYYSMELPRALGAESNLLYLWILNSWGVQNSIRTGSVQPATESFNFPILFKHLGLALERKNEILFTINHTYIEDQPIAEIAMEESIICWNIIYEWNGFGIISTWNAREIELREMPYRQYLKTTEWEMAKIMPIQEAGERCQLCYRNDLTLHVHHRTYVRRGNEAPNDLIVLCAHCHAKFHDKLPNGGDN